MDLIILYMPPMGFPHTTPLEYNVIFFLLCIQELKYTTHTYVRTLFFFVKILNTLFLLKHHFLLFCFCCLLLQLSVRLAHLLCSLALWCTAHCLLAKWKCVTRLRYVSDFSDLYLPDSKSRPCCFLSLAIYGCSRVRQAASA